MNPFGYIGYTELLLQFRGTNQGKKMKATFGWEYDGNGTNTSGFAGLPGGCRLTSLHGEFVLKGSNGYWWSSTEEDNNNVWSRGLDCSNDYVDRQTILDIQEGLSVRCLSD